jgi:fumarylacetoacetate (FAA) hydrolase
MRLATLRDGTRDGALIVVGPDGDRFLRPGGAAPTLQAVLENWDVTAPTLDIMSRLLAADTAKTVGESLDVSRLGPPLPRAYEWIDGSAFLEHVRRVRAARGAQPPASLETDPLVYQGGSGVLLGPRDDILLGNPDWGLDFESEVAVILGDTPQGTGAADAHGHVRLVMLANDITLRRLVPDELAKGFGFFQSKPATAFSPFAVTPDELGSAWRDGRVHLPVRTTYNGKRVGDPDAGEMHFSFFDLIAHVARTRAFTAGTILGSGTVSNADRARGVSCLVERRALEQIDGGSATTPFMAPGDTIMIEVRDGAGRDIFGRIEQRVQLGPRGKATK